MADIVEKKSPALNVKTWVNHHGNDIFLGLGIAFGVSAIGLAIHGTIKAVRLVDEKKKEKGESLTKKEILQTVWKCYIPTAIAEGLFIGCSLKSGAVSNKAIAAATAVAKVTQENLSNLEQATKDIVGEKKAKRIEEQAAQVYLDKHPMNGRNPIETGKGDTRFIDSWHGAAFRSSINHVESCKNRVNEMINAGDAVSLNDWFDLLGIQPDKAGYNEGWSADTTGLLEVYFDPGVWTDGEPCFVIKYHVEPSNKYMS